MKNPAWLALISLFISAGAMAQTSTDSTADEETRYDRTHVRVWGGLSQFDYNLDGGGGKVDATDNNNLSYGVTGDFKTTNFYWHAAYKYSEATFVGPSGNVPAQSHVNDTRLSASAGIKIFSNSGVKAISDIIVNGGYYQQTRSSDRSSPTEMAVNNDKAGVFFGAELTRPLNADFNYHAEANLYLINSFTEHPRTGYFQSGYTFEGKYSVMYQISKYVDLSTGLFIEYGGVKFRGGGDRGVTSAKETETKYGVPFDVWIFF